MHSSELVIFRWDENVLTKILCIQKPKRTRFDNLQGYSTTVIIWHVIVHVNIVCRQPAHHCVAPLLGGIKTNFTWTYWSNCLYYGLNTSVLGDQPHNNTFREITEHPQRLQTHQQLYCLLCSPNQSKWIVHNELTTCFRSSVVKRIDQVIGTWSGSVEITMIFDSYAQHWVSCIFHRDENMLT